MATPPPGETWLAVIDGKSVLIYRNEGFDDAPNLKLVSEERREDAPSRELGTDRPGRTPAGPGPARSAMEGADLHDQAERAFVRHAADALNAAASAGRFERLVVFADPRSLGRLREMYVDAARARIVAERPRDLAGQPIDAIEKAFVKALREVR